MTDLSQASGVFIITVTPFAEDGALDLHSLDRVIDFYEEKGVSGLTLLGIMGEAHKLTAQERLTVVSRVVERLNGRLPVVVGVSDAGLDNLIALASAVMDKGAAGVMVAPNASAKTENGIIAAFAEIAGRLPGVPLVYQDYPYATGMAISAQAFARLVTEVPTVKLLKHEDWPGLSKITALRTAEAAGTPRVAVLVGNGGLYLPQELQRGVDGAMTGFAYPEMLVEVVKRHHAGDVDGAEDLFDLYLPVLRHEQQPGFGLAVRKEILRRRGAIASATVRMPGPTIDAVGLAELDRLTARLHRRLAERAPALAAE